MKIISVPYPVLEEFAEKNSCMHLNMEEPARSTGKLIQFRERLWVCVGSVSQYAYYLEADLRECVPEGQYKGRSNDPRKSGHHYYTGGRFRANGKVYVMTNLEFTLRSNRKMKANHG